MTCWPLKDGSKDIYIDENFAVNNLDITNIQITHEVLHGLSQMKDGNQYFFGHKYDGNKNNVFHGIDEATTQLFAEEIENKRLSSEDDYLYFIKNVMRIMKVIFGVDKLANQYLNNTNEFENEFNKLSNNNFNYFIKIINDNYILSKKNNYNKLTKKEMDLLKSNQEEILNFVELLIFKSLENNPDIKNKINKELKLENFRELYIITNGTKKR